MSTVHVFQPMSHRGPVVMLRRWRERNATEGGQSQWAEPTARPEGNFATGCVKGLALSIGLWALIGTAAYLI